MVLSPRCLSVSLPACSAVGLRLRYGDCVGAQDGRVYEHVRGVREDVRGRFQRDHVRRRAATGLHGGAPSLACRFFWLRAPRGASARPPRSRYLDHLADCAPHSQIYKEFQQLYEGKLEGFLAAEGIEAFDFAAACKGALQAGEGSADNGFVEILLSMSEYEYFVKMMAEAAEGKF
eukprot:COSAG05_NODE_1172_length_5623_cov_3.561188_7_plen_176_part_00